MFTKELRTQFGVFLIANSSIILEAEPELAASGYRFSRLPLVRESLERLQRDTPDIVVFDASAVEGDVSLYVERIIKATPSSVIIAIVETVDNGLALKGQIYDFLLKPFVRGETLLNMIDKACEKTYYQNRVEQLLQRLKSNEPQFTPEKDTAKAELPLAANSKTVDLIGLLESATDPREAVRLFLEYIYENVEKQPLLFFKNLTGHRSLGISLSAGLSLEKLRGIGINLSDESVDERLATLRFPQKSQKLRTLMEKAFQTSSYVARPILVNQEVYGWLVKFGEFGTAANEAFFHSLSQVAEKIIENKSLKFRIRSLQTHDPDTELNNRGSLQRILKDEIARSRRTHLPVSLIIVSLDGFIQYEGVAGSANSLRLRKSLASLLKKTSRITDVAADLGNGEFALLMPHTNQRGAAVKAEKIRRVVESSEFPEADKLSSKKVTLSMGVSEYPGYSGDADSLFKTADDALFYVKGLGGNKVCLAKRSESFVPDFEAKEITR